MQKQLDDNIWIYWLTLVLAVDAIMVLWFKAGWLSSVRGILPFSLIRAHCEAWETSSKLHKLAMARVIRFLEYPFSCRLCLPLHLAFWLVVISTLFPVTKILLLVLATGGASSRLFNSIWSD